MVYPSYEEAVQIINGGDYKRIPLKIELCADMITPLMAIRRLKKVSRHVFLLESAEADKKWGRYTFVGFDPTLEFTCQNGVMRIKSGMEIKEGTMHPGDTIRGIIADNRSPVIEGMPPFTGGLVGYFSYDYIKYSETTLDLNADDEESFKDVDLMLFDKIVVFDNYRQKLILIVNVKTDDIATAYHKGELELRTMKTLLTQGEMAEDSPLRFKSGYRYLFGRDEYCSMVERAKKYIFEGDIFQVVLSNRLEAEMEGSLFNTYRVLRSTNPSPYMFYFSGDQIEVAGASPETLVKLENGVLHTFPLAGTRPRGKTKEEDMRLEAGLMADEKELAEHNMLVDLGRNDLGKISKFGTVEVEQYMKVQRYSHVMHIGSTVKGEIDDSRYDELSAVDAVLPAGTLSGAPKIRACQIINELEDNKRGIYGGAIGYIDFTGNLDTCIAIRIAYKKGDKVFVRSGAGIVADSVPENEFQECINKAKAVTTALTMSQDIS